MSKVFVVFSYWLYKGCPDNGANGYEDRIKKVFDSKEKAVAYIQNLFPNPSEIGKIEEETRVVTKYDNYEEWGMFYVGFNVE